MQPEDEVLGALDGLIERTEEVLARVKEGAIGALQACLDERDVQVRQVVALVKGLDAEALRREERVALAWARLQQLSQDVMLAMAARHTRARTAFSALNQKRTTTSAYGRTVRRPSSLLSVES